MKNMERRQREERALLEKAQEQQRKRFAVEVLRRRTIVCSELDRICGEVCAAAE